jgi:hypothetical protein
MEKFSWGQYIDFLNKYEITNVYEFVLWFRGKCYSLAIRNLGKLFKEAEKIETMYELDDTFELEATFFELNFFVEEKNNGKFCIDNSGLEQAGTKFTNHIFNKFLFNLSELGMVSLYYDHKAGDFFWRANK